ncbi:MAG: caspase family protein, partial [Cohaesibacter sp.]|nr:caspase family protein [Cohaesibacter sp.]
PHPTAPDISSYLPKEDYVIRSRVGFSNLATDVRFDPANKLVWMASGNQMRAFGMQGAMFVNQAMTDEQKSKIFAPSQALSHPLLNRTSIKEFRGKWVVKDNASDDFLFSFDYKKGDGDKALYARYQNIPKALLAYAYYESGTIRIWDIANKVLVKEYKQPRGLYPYAPDGGIAYGRFMLVDSLRAKRKITENESRIAHEGLKQSWSNAFHEKRDLFIKGMGKLGIAAEKKFRVLDLLTGRVSAALEPFGPHLGTCLKSGKTIMVKGQPLYLSSCHQYIGSDSEMMDLLAVWDLRSGKLLWSYQARLNDLGDQNGKQTYHYNLKADRIILPAHPVKTGHSQGNVSKIEIRRLSTGKVLQTALIAPSVISNGWATAEVGISDDGRHAAIGGTKGEVMLVDLQSGKQVWRSEARAFEEVAEEERFPYDPDWELDKPHMVKLLRGEVADSTKRASKVFPDSPGGYALRSEKAGLELVSFQNGDAVGGYKIRDIHTGDILARINVAPALYGDAALTPDGAHFALVVKDGARSRLRLYNSRTGEVVADLADGAQDEEWAFHGAKSWSEGFRSISGANAVFSPDGRWIFAAGTESDWTLYDSLDNKAYSMGSGSPYDYAKFEFDAHSRFLVLANLDGRVSVKDLTNMQTIPLAGASGEGHAFYTFKFLASKDGSKAVWASKERVDLWDLKQKKRLRQFKLDTDLQGGGLQCGTPLRAISPDGRFGAFHSCRHGKELGELWDLSDGKRLAVLDFIPSRFGADGRLVYGAAGINHVKVARVPDGAKMAEILAFEDNSWIVLTPQGFFNASAHGAQYLSILKGREAVSIDQAYDILYRPDLVKEALTGDPDGALEKAGRKLDLAAVMNNGAPPLIRSVTSQEGNQTEKQDVIIDAELALRSGGLGRVDVRVNGNLQTVCDGADTACRGLGAAISTASGDGDSQQSLQKVSRKVTLYPGRNVIEVVAYNSRNQIASAPARFEMVANYKLAAKSDLHILAIGINDYYDSGLKLQYALSDATGIIDGFSKAASGHFGQVHVTKVFDEAATTAGIEAAFEKVAKQAKPQDVFLFYIAGHGKSQDGHYYYLPQDFVDKGEDSIKEQGIGREKWRAYFSRILAEKSVLLYDTCESGSLVSRQSRSLNSRAMADRLKRATGRSTLAATSEEGVALEGIGGHGVFTYSILEGLTEADSDNDNFIELTELAGYVQQRLPDLSHKYFGYRQIPETQVVNSFPLGQKITKQVQSSDQFIPSTSTHVVIANVEVRKTGDESGQIIQSLDPGTLVRLVSENNGWAHIARKGKLLGFVPHTAIVAQQ